MSKRLRALLSPPRTAASGRAVAGPVVRWVAPFRRFDEAAGAAWEADLRGRPRSAEPLQWDGSCWVAKLSAQVGILLDPTRLELIAGWCADAWTGVREQAPPGRWMWRAEAKPDTRTWSGVARMQRKLWPEYMEVLVRQRGRRSAALAVFWTTPSEPSAVAIAGAIAGRLGLRAQPMDGLGIKLAGLRRSAQSPPKEPQLMDELVGVARKAIKEATGRMESGWWVSGTLAGWRADVSKDGALVEVVILEMPPHEGWEIQVGAQRMRVYHKGFWAWMPEGYRWRAVPPARRVRAVRGWMARALRAELARLRG